MEIFKLLMQVLMWMNQNFLLQDDLVVTGNTLHFGFTALRGAGPVVLKMEQGGQVCWKTST